MKRLIIPLSLNNIPGNQQQYTPNLSVVLKLPMTRINQKDSERRTLSPLKFSQKNYDTNQMSVPTLGQTYL